MAAQQVMFLPSSSTSLDPKNEAGNLAVEAYGKLVRALRTKRPRDDDEKSRQHDSLLQRLPPTIEELNARYLRKRKIGEGGFGDVYLALDRQTDAFVAIKIVRSPIHRSSKVSVGLHCTVARELHVLSELQHPNIVPLLRHEILENGAVLIVFPVIAHDLSTVIQRTGRRSPTAGRTSGAISSSSSTGLPLAVVKCLFRQLLQGVAYLHACDVIHRDIKTGNVMVHSDGTVVLIDFGWSRYLPGYLSSSSNTGDSSTACYIMTGPICVERFRPPEILVGARGAFAYGKSVDMWCMGHVLFELLRGSVAFPSARTELETVGAILELLGSPSASSGFYYGQGTQRAVTFPQGRPSRLEYLGSSWGWDTALLDLMHGLWKLEPAERISAEQALRHPWFTSDPLPCRKSDIPLPSSNSYRHVQRQLRQ